jgi:hypothetical protein
MPVHPTPEVVLALSGDFTRRLLDQLGVSPRKKEAGETTNREHGIPGKSGAMYSNYSYENRGNQIVSRGWESSVEKRNFAEEGYGNAEGRQ